MAYPEWVEKQRRPGTNISCIRGKYYLYEATSVWDKEKKRAQKKTGKYLGRITEDGLIPPKEKSKAEIKNISTKEYGASSLLMDVGKDIYSELRNIFPNEANEIFAIAVLRIIEHCPYKRIGLLYENSYLSELLGELPLSGSSISKFLRELGKEREKMVTYMRKFTDGTEHILFDGTNIITKSENLEINRMGYNSHRIYEPQVNLLYAFSSDKKMPIYYRIVPGNIRDVTSFRHAVTESGIKDMVVIADKGFGSEQNFAMLEDNNLRYIVPLRRNNGLFDREKLKTGNKSDFDGYFMFNGRIIWYYSYEVDKKKLFVYQDSVLKTKEEQDYLARVESNLDDYTTEKFLEKQYDFGTIVFRTNLECDAQELYKLYKTRGEIEQSFDFLKNILDLDTVYLQDTYALEAWAFINHVSLMLAFLLYNLLRTNNLLSEYSVSDLLIHLKYIHKIKVNNSWLYPEISGKTTKLLTSLGVHIT